jgi:hypothetical protein
MRRPTQCVQTFPSRRKIQSQALSYSTSHVSRPLLLLLLGTLDLGRSTEGLLSVLALLACKGIC